ncbi:MULTISPECIES: hypothetical protein [Kocuria]|uniref:Uncharacterized protein n=1 Tax=Kocuria subflava TaxID=1736139 RepID=A0A846TZC6_9MICC|nr:MULTISPECIES: hypothetical protein [Kocuria]NKE09625.1 hypothetical protein [Kocuria subflava]
MGRSFQLVDPTSVEDVRTYLTRARTINDDAAVRFQGVGGAVGIWTCVLTRAGLLDSTPTVLGLRTAGLGEPSTLDAVVNVGSVLDRMPRFQGADDAVLRLPPYDDQASWAGISPSLSGWEPAGMIHAQDLVLTAKAGTEEVAQTVPTDSGKEMVQRVRSAVWSRVSEWGQLSENNGNSLCTVPDGAAFAAWALGFLRSDDDSQVAVAVNGSWSRLSCPGGFVLTRS